MNTCLFCHIVSGEASAHRVYEDNNYLGFLDIRPLTKGHTLVIPKKHIRWVYEVKNVGEYWETVHTITRILQKSLKPKWINYFTYGEIPHAHIHILPRYNAITTKPPILPKEHEVPQEELARLAKKIRTQSI